MVEIVILILNYKTYQDTIRVTNEFLRTNRTDYKIIIIDNSSPNESFPKLESEFGANIAVDVIQSPENGGYAKGNNYGLRYAKKYSPKYVCIINNDVHFSWNTIESLCYNYEKLDNPAIIAPIQLLPGGVKPNFSILKVPDLIYDLRLNTFLFKPKLHVYESNTRWSNVQKVGYIPGAFLFTNYNVFEHLGFFDEGTFLFCEERFTAKAVQKAGLCNYLILDLEYVHEHSKTISKESSKRNQRKMIQEGRELYHKRYSKYPLLSILLLRIVFYIHEFELTVLSLLKK